MKLWIILAVFPLLLACPAISGALEDTLDPGRSNGINLMNLPLGAATFANKDRELKGEGEPTDVEKQQKDIRDKKVDDAIKKAWEEK
jgi:hypothetical protein